MELSYSFFRIPRNCFKRFYFTHFVQHKECSRAAMLDYLRSVGVNVSLLQEANLSDSEIEAIVVGIMRLLEKPTPIQRRDLS